MNHKDQLRLHHGLPDCSIDHIALRGVTTHNLKSVNLDVPKHRFVVLTGVSGSGKSSLVFDTIYTEAQRQLIETFSTYARRRLPQLTRPPVESIRGISPCIVIDQKHLGASSRSTVGTVTEIYTYLRMLFSRASCPFIGWSHLFSFNHPEGMCPACKGLGKRIAVDVDKLLDRSKSIREGGILHPNYDIDKWYYREILWSGVVPFDTKLGEMSEKDLNRLLWADKLPIQYEDRGKLYHRTFDGVVRKLEQLHVNKDENQLSNTAREAYERLFHTTICPDCNGARLNSQSLSVQLASGHRIGDLIELELTELDAILADLPAHPDYKHMKEVITTLVTKMRSCLGHLIDIGASYLSLNRSVNTLSGGESQRVKMARQLDCDLVDLIYILDEPTVGLHARDIDHLVDMLHKLRDSGNSVLVVEHDTNVMRAADWIVDVGPAAGEKGGQVLYSGQVKSFLRVDTPTSKILRVAGRKIKAKRRQWKDAHRIEAANTNNLKNITVDIPKGVLTCLTGVAGSGKSSLVVEFVATLSRSGDDCVIVVDQKPVGRSNRSNPVTYVGIFDAIRHAFSEANNVSPALFSFNSKGTCPECSGRGFIKMELSFIDDVVLECSTCHGRRYREEVLGYQYSEKSIHDILEMSVEEAAAFFLPLVKSKNSRESKIVQGLQLLREVGLGYLRLGQPLSTLSGGEAQRIKLSAELTKSGNTYVMDEPTTGLHSTDIDRLLAIISRLLDAGNTVVVIEHNLDVIASADWVIDIGPEGGKKGGSIVAEGTPEDLRDCAESHTGYYLKKYLQEVTLF